MCQDTSALANARIFDKEELYCYPRPTKVIYDNGNEFIGKYFQELLVNYGIKTVPTTVKNHQANVLIEWTYLNMDNKLRTVTFEVTNLINDVDIELQAIA